MQTSLDLLRVIGQAVYSAAGPELAGDSLLDVLPEVVRETRGWWGQERDEARRRAEVEALIQAPPEAIRAAAAEVVASVAADQPAEVRAALATYLEQVPATIRQALRRPADPAGMIVPPDLPLLKAEDLLPFLPTRLPRFQPGDRPLPNAERQLVELLGVGAFSEVWKARNPSLASAPPVALKFCLDAPSARVLRSEAKLLDRLMFQGKHPGVVPLRQTYLTADPPCLEYEYVPGGDLTGVLHEWHRHRHGPSPTQIARVVLRLAKIVAFAHRLEPPIVHRDLKPSNILALHAPDGKLILRVSDFGTGGVAASHAIRQALRGTAPAQRLASAGRGAWTPLYASPQQMSGADPDPRDDVYALGIIWYQLLTGNPSVGRPAGRRWTQRLAEHGMAAALVELLSVCFAENADDRPRNAGALAEALTALLQEKETEAAGTEAGGTEALPAAAPRRFSNAIGMTLVLVPAGTFRMGSPPSEPERSDDEGPQHEVTLTQPFYVGLYPVTQRQYETVMGENPSYFNSSKGGGPDFPVERVSWYDAVAFCQRLAELPAEKEAGRVYRLPTEAEWEYACRGGLPTPFASGVTLSSREANFNGNYPYGTTPRGPYLERTTKVGSYPPNAFGLFDMHGNVWEWCSDWYDRTYYRNSPRYDPPGPPAGTLRVVRGGSCYNIGRFCRAAYRFGVAPENRDLDVGLRVVMALPAGT